MTPVCPSALLHAAVAAAERGWPVFPVRVGDKRPTGHAEEFCPRTGRCAAGHLTPEQRATTDLEQITRCWQHAPYNVGIATGPAGLVVIDLDTPKNSGDTPPTQWAGMNDGLDVFAAVCERAGQRMPTETYTVRTRRAGLHLYFAAPVDKRLRSGAGVLGWKVDVRSWGGYVVAPGSTVAGRAYTVVHDAPPAPLPAWLLPLLTPPPAPAPMPLHELKSRMKNASAYVTAAVSREVDKVRAAGEGGRNRALYGAAYALARFVETGDLPETVATDALTAAGASVGLPPGECATAIRSGLSRGRRRPVRAA
jgi:Bifunctional DNA primase/polymerase, N-terminal